MDSNILWIMLCVVGITELIKKFITKELPTWLITLITIVVGLIVCSLFFFLPDYWDKIKVVLVSVSGATVFYDTVFKSFKRYINGNKDEIPGDSDSLR